MPTLGSSQRGVVSRRLLYTNGRRYVPTCVYARHACAEETIERHPSLSPFFTPDLFLSLSDRRALFISRSLFSLPLALSLSVPPSLALWSLISTATYIPFPVMLTSLNNPTTESERARGERAARSFHTFIVYVYLNSESSCFSATSCLVSRRWCNILHHHHLIRLILISLITGS